MSNKESRLCPFLTRAAIAASLGLGFITSTLSTAAEEKKEDADELEEVHVTGSRIVRVDYVSPNPIQTIDAQQLENLGINNIADAITQIPANVSSFQARNQGGNPFFVGSTLANLRGLNPYFGTRTLTLVDGHRFVPTNQGESVDLNVIPELLVSRMEVVTGGASAAYGSDAVSGVVNVILDKRLEGMKFEADYGATQRGDGGNYHFGLAAGTKLLDGKAHLIFGAEYQNTDSIDDCSAARSWCRKSEGFLLNGGSGFEAASTDPANPVFYAAPGAGPFASPPLNAAWPQRVRVSDLRVNQANAYGVIFNRTANATTAISANAAGTGTMNFAIGQYGTLSPTQTVIGGDGAPTTAITSLFPNIERATVFTRMSFDLNDSTEAFVEASFAQVNAFVTQGGPGFILTTRCVSADNAYLSGAFGAAVLAAAGNDTRPFGGCAPNQTVVRKDWYSQINRNVKTDTGTARVLFGLNGRFGSSSWNWDTYYQHGRTDRTQTLADNNTSKRMDMALDAVIDNRAGANFGKPVCRVTRDGVQPPYPNGPIDPARVALAVGCVPLNMFGNAPLTRAQHDYSFGDLFEENVINQDVLAFNVNGELWKGWGAGPLSGAAGVEYRTESLTNDAANLPFYQRTDFASQYGDPFAGHTQVKEGYVELEMSLLKDLPFARDLRLNLAGRRTNYNTRDDLVATNPATDVKVKTWKLGAVWDPLDWLRIRGSRSRDLRAAGFRELYYSQSIPADPPGTQFGFGGVTNEWLPPGAFGPVFDPSVNILSGNSGLRPEKATTTTVGFVLSPGWAQGMHFSADWYSIKLIDGISGGLLQNTVHMCHEGDQYYCSLIEGVRGTATGPTATVKGPDGRYGFYDITQVRAPYANGRPYRAEGVDLTWDYKLSASQLISSAPGDFAVSLSATHALKTILEYLQYPNYVSRNVVGQVGQAGFLADYQPTPKWQGNMAVSWLNGPAVLTLQTQWVGSGKMNNELPWIAPGDPLYDPTHAGTVDDNTVGSYLNFNLNGSYDLSLMGMKQSQVFLTVSNLLDTKPPFSNGGVGGVNGTFYDTLGRSFRVGFRMKF